MNVNASKRLGYAARLRPSAEKNPKGAVWQQGQVIWGMQGASGIVSALLEALKLLTVSLQALGPSREAQATSAASSETPAGQREASSHPLCTLGKPNSCIIDLTEYSAKQKQECQTK